MTSVGSMMTLTSTVSGGGLTEAAPGGVLLTRTGIQWTFTVDASVSVPTYSSSSGNTYLIPYSSNYCVAILGPGGDGGSSQYANGGRGGNLAYNNGMTLSVGQSFVVTLGTHSTGQSNLSFPGGSLNIGWYGVYSTTGTGSQFTPRYAGGGGSGGSYYGGGGGGNAGHWTQGGSNGTNGGGGTSSNGQGGEGTNPFNTTRTTPGSSSQGKQYGGGGGGGGWNGASPGYGYFGFFRLIYGLNRGFNVSNWDNSNNYPGGTADLQLT